jgi:single-stranded DNA-binding protein
MYSPVKMEFNGKQILNFTLYHTVPVHNKKQGTWENKKIRFQCVLWGDDTEKDKKSKGGMLIDKILQDFNDDKNFVNEAHVSKSYISNFETTLVGKTGNNGKSYSDPHYGSIKLTVEEITVNAREKNSKDNSQDNSQPDEGDEEIPF